MGNVSNFSHLLKGTPYDSHSNKCLDLGSSFYVCCPSLYGILIQIESHFGTKKGTCTVSFSTGYFLKTYREDKLPELSFQSHLPA